jgi:hypothetical protein
MLTAARMGLNGMMAPICIGFDEANPAYDGLSCSTSRTNGSKRATISASPK